MSGPEREQRCLVCQCTVAVLRPGSKLRSGVVMLCAECRAELLGGTRPMSRDDLSYLRAMFGMK